MYRHCSIRCKVNPSIMINCSAIVSIAQSIVAAAFSDSATSSSPPQYDPFLQRTFLLLYLYSVSMICGPLIRNQMLSTRLFSTALNMKSKTKTEGINDAVHNVYNLSLIKQSPAFRILYINLFHIFFPKDILYIVGS